MAVSFYRKAASNQMKTVTSNMMAGMNTYHDAFTIGDSQLASAWNVYSDDVKRALTFKCIKANTLLASNLTGTGSVVGAIAAKDTSNNERIIMILNDAIDGADAYLDDLVDLYPSGNTNTGIDISSHQFSGNVSMCLFNTEAARYVCFVASGTKKLGYYNFSSVSTVALPFYPKKIASHYNRIFAIDTGNKVWWCRAGDFTTWYGLEQDDDYIVTVTNMKNGAYTLLASPDVPRPIMVTITTVDGADTLGTLTLVGTDVRDEALTEVMTLKTGVNVSFKAFKTLTSATGASWSATSTADTIKIGIAAVGNGYVQNDQGYWTIESEPSLIDIVALSNNLYVWSENNIYVFQGYSYDVFSLTKIVADLGANALTVDIASCGNIAYFWGNDGDIYEYNGESYPKVINRPVYVNGSVINGVYGSKEAQVGTIQLCATLDYLYVYDSRHPTYATHRQLSYYSFDIRERTWWKRASFHTVNGLSYANYLFNQIYIPTYSKTSTYNIMWEKTAASTVNYYVYTYMGSDPVAGNYMITKTFNDAPSTDMTLTNIVLCLSANTTGWADVNDVSMNVYYGIDGVYTLVKTINGGDFDASENRLYVTINLINSDVARKKYYNIMITSATDSEIYIHSIERRYRVQSRSR